MDSNTNVSVSNRPAIISILCGYFFVTWAIIVINIIQSLIYKALTFGMLREAFMDKMFIIYFLAIIVSLVGVIGIWMMRSWGVLTYAVATAGLIVLFLMQNTFSMGFLGSVIISLLPNIVLAIAGFVSWDRVS